MLRRIIGGVVGLALAAFGVALIGGWSDPAEIDSEGGSRRGRSLKRLVTWLTDTLGATGGGAVVCAAGLAVVVFALRSGAQSKPKGKGES